MVGALSLGGQALGGVWGRLGNSGAVWLCAAFVVGSLLDSMRRAALGGFLTLAGAVIGYYAAASWFVSAGVSATSVGIWVATAAVGGPVFGAAGETWRRGTGWPRIIAAALLGGAVVGEGLYLAGSVPDARFVVGPMAVIGLALPGVLLHVWRDRVRGWLLLPAFAGLTVGAYHLIDRVFAR